MNFLRTIILNLLFVGLIPLKLYGLDADNMEIGFKRMIYPAVLGLVSGIVYYNTYRFSSKWQEELHHYSFCGGLCAAFLFYRDLKIFFQEDEPYGPSDLTWMRDDLIEGFNWIKHGGIKKTCKSVLDHRQKNLTYRTHKKF